MKTSTKIPSNTKVKIPFARAEPIVPVDIIEAYGDARAEKDRNATAQRLAECISAIRRVMPTKRD